MRQVFALWTIENDRAVPCVEPAPPTRDIFGSPYPESPPGTTVVYYFGQSNYCGSFLEWHVFWVAARKPTPSETHFTLAQLRGQRIRGRGRRVLARLRREGAWW